MQVTGRKIDIPINKKEEETRRKASPNNAKAESDSTPLARPRTTERIRPHLGLADEMNKSELMMESWEFKRLAKEFQVADPLETLVLEFNKEEWLNIPGVVPKFSLAFLAHMNALKKWCSLTQSSLAKQISHESSKRQEIEQSTKESYEGIFQRVKAQLDSLKGQIDSIDLERQREKETEVKEHQSINIEAIFAKLGKDPAFPEDEKVKAFNSEASNEREMNKAQKFSVNQLESFGVRVINRSGLASKTKETMDRVYILEQSMKRLERNQESFEQKSEKEIESLQSKIQGNRKEIEKTEEKVHILEEMSKIQQKNIEGLLDFVKDAKSFQDGILFRVERQTGQISSLSKRIDERLDAFSLKFNESVAKLENHSKKIQDEMETMLRMKLAEFEQRFKVLDNGMQDSVMEEIQRRIGDFVQIEKRLNRTVLNLEKGMAQDLTGFREALHEEFRTNIEISTTIREQGKQLQGNRIKWKEMGTSCFREQMISKSSKTTSSIRQLSTTRDSLHWKPGCE